MRNEKMPPRVRSRGELIAASEHVHTAFAKSIALSRHLGQVEPPRREHLELVCDAMIDSAAIQIRALLGFAYDYGKALENDVLAVHYVASWVTIRPAVPELNPLKDRADKEVAHLTYQRPALGTDGRKWKFRPIYNALVRMHGAFMANVDKKLLHQVWADALRSGPLVEVPTHPPTLPFDAFEDTYTKWVPHPTVETPRI